MRQSEYRNVPPLRSLKAFEAAARHLSFTKAAKELHVTQAAISYQIKILEERLGVALFKRLNRALILAEDGQRYLPEVRDALDMISAATDKIMHRYGSATLVVSVTPSFAAKWLVPRLWKFQQECPDLNVRISAFEWLVDFEKEEVDLAIRSGHGNWPGLNAYPLLTENVFPVCSPQLRKGEHPLLEPKDLRHQTLLHDDFGREDWRIWLKAANVHDLDPDKGLSFSHTSLMLDAAIRGLGVALGRTPLVAEDLATGRLVKPFEISLPADLAYYVVCPKVTADHAPIRKFREWLLAEAKLEVGSPKQPLGSPVTKPRNT